MRMVSFKKKENINLDEVFKIVSTYAYDKKSRELYVQTDRANCIVTVNDDLHKKALGTFISGWKAV